MHHAQYMAYTIIRLLSKPLTEFPKRKQKPANFRDELVYSGKHPNAFPELLSYISQIQRSIQYDFN